MAAYRKARPPIDYVEGFPEGINSYNESRENQERLFSILRHLNDTEKALVCLYLEDFSYQEIAEITGISESNVGVRLNRIKSKLKEIIK